jgi:hypothetical protein
MTVRDIGLNFGGPAGFPQGRGDYTAVASDTVSYTRGRHSVKIGGEFRRFNGNNFASTPGTLAFNSVTDFLNGRAATFTANPSSNPSRIFVSALGGFVQDSYRILPTLTLDLGFRYDWFGTPVEALDRFTVFDPTTASLVRVGSGIDEVYGQNTRNFQPRAGLAWDVFGGGRTVLRAAYAIQADQPVANLVTQLPQNPPFANPVSFNGPGTVTFENAFTAARSAGSLSPTTVSHDFRNPYVQSWNVNIQQALPGELGVMAGYFGNKGTHLRTRSDPNQFFPGTNLRPYPAVSAASAIAPGAALASMTLWDSSGNSLYNALWLTANKRLSRGLQLNASYTWSKSIDYTSLNSQGATTLQDSFNVRGDRGLSDFDARHRFVFSGIYELPFRGHRLTEGWQVAAITQLQSGNPINIVTTNATFTGLPNTLRPDLLGDVPTGIGSAPNGNPQYFPSAACATPTPGCLFLVKNGFGSLGRNSIIGPGFNDVDFSLFKNTRVTERVAVQLRSDFFNLFNHPNFGQPNRIVSTAAGNTFGQITTTRFPVGDSGSSRQIQLALKLMF